MKFLNPIPSSPSRWSAGTSTSSKISSRVSEARHPSLSSFFPARNPGIGANDGSCPTPAAAAPARSHVSFVKMKLEIPLVPRVGSVTAVTTKTSPTPPCVMKRFVPFSTYRSPRRTAVVCVPPASEPAPGSVSPKPPSTRPDASRGTNRSRWASVPKWTMGDVPSVVWAEMVMAWDAQTTASSSIAIMKAMVSSPAPPSDSGHGIPSNPRSAIFRTFAHGNDWSASCAAATGATSSCAKARTISREARWCGSKYGSSVMGGGFR